MTSPHKSCRISSYILLTDAVTESHSSSGRGGIDLLSMETGEVSEDHVKWEILLENIIAKEGENEKMLYKYLACKHMLNSG